MWISTDELSRVHYKAVRAEIEGRFFSREEAEQLRQAIEERTIVDPEMRAMAAKAWDT